PAAAGLLRRRPGGLGTAAGGGGGQMEGRLRVLQARGRREGSAVRLQARQPATAGGGRRRAAVIRAPLMPSWSLRRLAGSTALLLAAACAFPVRQFELKDRPYDCKQANRYAYFTLRSMGFSLVALEPATEEHPGAMHGYRKSETGTETAT